MMRTDNLPVNLAAIGEQLEGSTMQRKSVFLAYNRVAYIGMCLGALVARIVGKWGKLNSKMKESG